MGFSIADMQQLDSTVRWLEGTSYAVYHGRAKPNTGLDSGLHESGPDAIGWTDLTTKQRADVLLRCFNWTHFWPQEVDRITANIAAGLERTPVV